MYGESPNSEVSGAHWCQITHPVYSPGVRGSKHNKSLAARDGKVRILHNTVLYIARGIWMKPLVAADWHLWQKRIRDEISKINECNEIREEYGPEIVDKNLRKVRRRPGVAWGKWSVTQKQPKLTRKEEAVYQFYDFRLFLHHCTHYRGFLTPIIILFFFMATWYDRFSRSFLALLLAPSQQDRCSFLH